MSIDKYPIFTSMRDFKSRHKSNWPVRDRQPTILEYIGGGFLLCAMMYGLLWYALVQATGGI